MIPGPPEPGIMLPSRYFANDVLTNDVFTNDVFTNGVRRRRDAPRVDELR